jgi:DNA-binding transcriptional MerR regulator
MENQKRYTMDELVALSGFSRRTIRYYIQERLLDPPAGRGRGGFYYDSHLDKLRLIRSLQEKNLGLSAIAARLGRAGGPGEQARVEEGGREPWTRFNLVPGLEMNVRRDVEERHRRKLGEIIRLARLLIEEGRDE